MSTYKQEFQLMFYKFLHHFVLVKVATTSIRVNPFTSGVHKWSVNFIYNSSNWEIFDEHKNMDRLTSQEQQLPVKNSFNIVLASGYFHTC